MFLLVYQSSLSLTNLSLPLLKFVSKLCSAPHCHFTTFFVYENHRWLILICNELLNAFWQLLLVFVSVCLISHMPVCR